jgi:3-oxoadipate enol-lactonase
MPDIKTDDSCTIHVELEGPERAPVLMLSNSLGTNLHMWDEQIAPWTRHFRLVRYDRRGHGKSSVPKGPYSMERLGRDVLTVLDGLGIAKIDWCGLSMGGMVGMWLGANAANRVDKLILSNTSSYFPDKAMWDGRIKTVRENGLASIVDANMERWFTKGFRDRSPPELAKIRQMFLATNPEGYIGCGEAIRDMDHRPLLPKISAPTLVIAGKHDPATPLEGNEYIREHIPGAKIAVLETAHIANMEEPQAYTETVLNFLLK